MMSRKFLADAVTLRKLALLFALVALFGCELAYAARWCHVPPPGADPSAATGCHGDAPADDHNGRDQANCPGNDLIPDIGAPIFIAAALTGHDYLAGAEPRNGRRCYADLRTSHARAGPELATLCRLLI